MGAFKKVSESVVNMRRIRVRPDRHRKGIGEMIVKELEKRAKNMGYGRIELHTTVDQVPAQRLYQKNGYRETHRENNAPGSERIHYKKDI